jgi:hypothetical protein
MASPTHPILQQILQILEQEFGPILGQILAGLLSGSGAASAAAFARALALPTLNWTTLKPILLGILETELPTLPAGAVKDAVQALIDALQGNIV